MLARSSLRFRFALGAVGLACLIVALFATGTFLHIRAEQFEEVDLELAAEARHLADAFAGGDLAATRSYQPWIGLAVLDPEGRLLRPPERLPAALLPEAVSRLASQLGARPRTVHLPDAAWRVALYPAGPGHLLIGYDLAEVHDILNELAVAYLVGTLLVVALAAAGAWWLSGRLLAPMARLTHAAEAIDIHRLAQRVPVPATRDELQRLAQVLNAMLARLEAGVAQARRFSADASHELRTPLTIMRGELDRLLHSAELAPAHESRLLRLQEATGRLQRITETLLLLARLDAGAPPSAPARLDFSALVREAGEDAALLAEGTALHLEIVVEPGLDAPGDAGQLRRLTLNLLDNAIRYNHPSGRVTCRLARVGGRLELRVANTGPGLPPELRARLFQRFSRGDAARGAGGHGLGLALAAEIARAHGGELRLASAPAAPLTEFLLVLPGLPAS